MVLFMRAITLCTSIYLVAWWPAHAREMWPTLLQLAVHLLLLAHAPRQDRLMRARWRALRAGSDRARHEE